ncbi:DUF4190 domain-containing protein [Leifsonia virtsii]|uniref:DUF4190 domain-containing protein n=1 Tax=Leifsonia virtsii TaxID=3035915 RepID=A0ABT8IWR5_9MICO|nr:DUF4190 domain-containing protein [Leifsonia virtsii]MDN4597252.1 DUF4190 domain-containing protein [Leifsonia virtsii]
MTDQNPQNYPPAPQQGYPQQPAYAPYPAQPAGTNVLAIISLIGAFVFPLAGVICGHIALSQIKRTGENGRGLAIAGLIIGYVYIAFVVLFVIIAIIAGVIAASSGSSYSY